MNIARTNRFLFNWNSEMNNNTLKYNELVLFESGKRLLL